MYWSKKINNKKYFTGTLVATILAMLGGLGRPVDTLTLFVVVAGSVLYQWLMFVILEKMFWRKAQGDDADSFKTKMIFRTQVALKFSVMGFIFYYLTHYARHIVAQGMILFTFQLIILILSIKNIGDFTTKGSTE